MPELAEVQFAVDGLQPLVSNNIEDIDVYHPSWVKRGDINCLRGQQITAIKRWGKRIRMSTPRQEIVFSLGMTGSARLTARDDDVLSHCVLSLTSDEYRLQWVDPRRFGNALIYDSMAEADADAGKRIGIDAASEMPTEKLKQQLAASSSPIKARLLDQSGIAGIGNYLADEILWDARIHPSQKANTLSDGQWDKLNASRLVVIERALQAGGLSIRDYVHTDGSKGEMLLQLQVFGRNGQPCPRCSSIIVKEHLAGRGTHWCPKCQQ